MAKSLPDSVVIKGVSSGGEGGVDAIVEFPCGRTVKPQEQGYRASAIGIWALQSSNICFDPAAMLITRGSTFVNADQKERGHCSVP
jgi:hypothetical protein